MSLNAVYSTPCGIEVHAFPGRSRIVSGIRNHLRLLFRFVVPKANRVPLKLAIVLDCSEQDEGPRLKCSKELARHIVEALREEDELFVVAYGATARVLVEGKNGTDKGKKDLLDGINKARPMGVANLLNGLSLAHMLVGTSRQCANACDSRILLIGKGSVEAGVQDTDQIQREIRQWAQEGTTLGCVGVGEDSEVAMLWRLAHEGQGPLVCLTSAENENVALPRIADTLLNIHGLGTHLRVNGGKNSTVTFMHHSGADEHKPEMLSNPKEQSWTVRRALYHSILCKLQGEQQASAEVADSLVSGSLFDAMFDNASQHRGAWNVPLGDFRSGDTVQVLAEVEMRCPGGAYGEQTLAEWTLSFFRLGAPVQLQGKVVVMSERWGMSWGLVEESRPVHAARVLQQSAALDFKIVKSLKAGNMQEAKERKSFQIEMLCHSIREDNLGEERTSVIRALQRAQHVLDLMAEGYSAQSLMRSCLAHYGRGRALSLIDWCEGAETVDERQLFPVQRNPLLKAPSRDPSPDACRASEGDDRALWTAAREGEASRCKALLDRGAALDFRGEDLKTPLHWAAYHSLLDVVGLLVSRRASADAKDITGQTALLAAASSGRIEVCKTLLSLGASPAPGDAVGRTALHWAAAHGHAEIIKSLLEHKADPFVPDVHGWPARRLASLNGHKQIHEDLFNIDMEEGHVYMKPRPPKLNTSKGGKPKPAQAQYRSNRYIGKSP
eukprot:gnl/MRDRNA2_/MRDRNA2_139041_c0_seq1.p1 gnl/MRDRNA2_/MRDRNA2_139041_c0~~gnl/MRDRNA2_/MRDRNA2_139041_c0_seq1.p1  ORF type:complete len:725 (-),score=135.32 gnl/MRDRNA2_/MRDRNA2_139041_c0_seq1:249-2423(-)